MISEATERFVPMPSAFYLYVEDADSAMEQALASGASLEMEVADMPYGDRTPQGLNLTQTGEKILNYAQRMHEDAVSIP